MLTRSLRWRLQLWLACLLVAVLGGFGFTIYQLQRVTVFAHLDEQLARRVAAVSGAVRGGTPPLPGAAPPAKEHFRPHDFAMTPELSALFDATDPDGLSFVVWSREGAVFKRSTNAASDVVRPSRAGSMDTRVHTLTRRGHREAFHFTELGDCVLVGRSFGPEAAALHRFAGWLFAAGAFVFVVAVGGGWWLTSRAIRPLEDIGAAASRISAGNLSERIDVTETHSELGQLAAVLNSTFARLEAAFERQKRFTADASHELRTRLAVIIAEAQTTLARRRRARRYRETIAVCLDAAQQMRRLTESLLALARLDAGETPLPRTIENLARHVSSCVDGVRRLAEGRGIDIHLDLQTAHALANPQRIDQLVTNLVTNAIHHNRPAGEVRITTRAEHGWALLTVADSGPGIPAEDLPRVFERFYRADRSRSRANGGTGLGLAICKAIVDAEGGAIDVASRPRGGTTVSVRLPGPASAAA